MTTYFLDRFTSTFTDLIYTHPPDAPIDGAWVGEVRDTVGGVHLQVRSAGNAGPSGLATSSFLAACIRPRPTRREYDVSTKLIAISIFSDEPAWLVARLTDANNFYAAGFYNAAANPDMKIVKKVSGVITVIASGNFGPAVNDVMRFQVRDATKKLFQNALERLSTTDNVLTSAGTVGLGFGRLDLAGDDIGDGWSVDDFTLENLQGADVSLRIGAGVEESNLLFNQNADVTLGTAHHIVTFLALGTRNAFLPPASAGRREYLIKSESGSTHGVNIVRSGSDTIDDLASNITIYAGEKRRLLSNGVSNWIVLDS